ncbi:hypothetical protein [methane-oxidizing endosymbiont of Gigantopelta aegis]|uniref:hypothetical protein n=1 Tax=methane-oxidizing endosymbiont of Gigantopelta aegis TaxID=2794938 RepID=UPI0018DBCF2D|nr:hypothetical protein [methane-oxidizing endosymbiont of Gigantopelta aegis]
MHKTGPEDFNVSKQNVVFFEGIPRQQALVRVNRVLLFTVTALVAIIFIAGFWLIPSYSLVEKMNAQQKSQVSVEALHNPVLSQEINILKGQLVGLISGSIESKLRVLEQSIRSGSLAASLGAIEDIKNDVKVLRSYSAPEKSQKNTNSSDATQLNERLIAEVSHLKRLIYMTLASCGLMVAAIAGFWLRHRFRLEQQLPRIYLRAMKK